MTAAAKKGQHGGARPGAGAKPKEPERLNVEACDDPIEFLRRVMKDPLAEAKTRLAAASKLATLQSGGYKGKKEQQQGEAERVASGKFAPSAPPKLRAVG